MDRNINSLNEKATTGSNAFQNAMMAYYKYKQGQPEVAPTDQQYENSTNSLREASQYAENRGIDTALGLMDDPNFRGRDNSGLINSAQNAFRPGMLSADKQLAQLADIKAQENEARRLAEEERSNRASEAKKASETNSYTDQELRKLRAAGIDETDILAADEYLYGTGDKTPLSSEYYPTISKALVKEFSGLFKGYAKYGKDPIQRAINFVNEVGTIKINGKDVKLSKAQKQLLIDSIKAEYPEGRTFGQRLMPGGK